MSRTYEDELKRNIEIFDQFRFDPTQQKVWDAIKRELTRGNVKKGKGKGVKGRVEFGKRGK